MDQSQRNPRFRPLPRPDPNRYVDRPPSRESVHSDLSEGDKALGLGPDSQMAQKERALHQWRYETYQKIAYTGELPRTFANVADPEWPQYTQTYKLPDRPGYNKSGKQVNVGLNAFQVDRFPDLSIHQYDILIGNGREKRGLIQAVWECPTVQQGLGPFWLFDGNKIAWSLKGITGNPPDLESANDPTHQFHTFKIDMDEERNKIAAENADVNKTRRKQPERENNKFKVQVRYAKTITLTTLIHFLARETDFTESVLEGITFLNHLLRATPSKNLLTMKSSYFPKQWPRPYELDNGLYAVKGVFQSIRAAYQGRMIVNVDVSHACFYQNRRMDVVAMQICGNPNAAEVIRFVQKNQKDPPRGPYREGPMMDRLRRLRKVAFHVNYRGASEDLKKRRWIVKDIMYTNAYNTFFKRTDFATGETERICVADHFERTYGFNLEQPLMPLIETTKHGIYYPMEVCIIETGERWPFKLNEKQTADMIKFAVSRPDARMQGIQQGLQALNWRNDPYLQHFGLKISDRMIETKARLLEPPKVKFANEQYEAPGYSGRWRIDKKKFYRPNSKPLQHWGVVLVTSSRGRSIGQQEVFNFMREFVRMFREYGGVMENATPKLYQNSELHPEACVDGIYDMIRKEPGKPEPLFVVFVLPKKEQFLYNSLKRHCDLKYGFVSQMVQSVHVQRNNPQYIANVLMKVNAKLGGSSFKAWPIQGPVATRKGNYFSKPTVIIGADVSHPGVGMVKPSMAAMTMSMDRDAIRYAACVQSNGFRQEMITPWNVHDMLTPLVREWTSTLNGGKLPVHVIYFRDGVSEGQFQHVIQQEVRDIRNVFKELAGGNTPELQKMRFTVIVASKRHHIRFFPKPGPGCDKNKNACPGTLVERDVTSPFEYDFYLTAHSAIQGTARPVHYTVLMDQEEMETTSLQNLIYEHSYQYIRSSTPVSIHPSIYYAHLASRRANAHERTQEGPLKKHVSSEQRERDLLMRAKGEADQTGKVMTKAAVKKLEYYMKEEYPPLHPTAKESYWSNMWFI